VHARRLARSHLAERTSPAKLLEVVRDTCGVHAQVMAAAELSIAARVDGLARADVQAELWERRRLVKNWTLRGTIHLHPADEMPLWMAARRVEPYWREPKFLETFGLTNAQADGIREAIGDALQGRALTREELGDEVTRRVGRWARKKTKVIQFGEPAETWPQLIGAAAQTGLLCHGPMRGRNVTFVRTDEWLGGWEEVDPRAALAEVFRRYLSAYGPATPEEFAHWFNGKPALARELADAQASKLEEVDVEGRQAWQLRRERSPRPAPSVVRLVPHYDVYVIGCAPPGEQRERLKAKPVFDRGAGPFPALLVDGVIAGTWKREQRGKGVHVRVELFRRLTAAQRKELGAETERLGEFLGAEASLSFG
jgi:hypothetical protein